MLLRRYKKTEMTESDVITEAVEKETETTEKPKSKGRKKAEQEKKD